MKSGGRPDGRLDGTPWAGRQPSVSGRLDDVDVGCCGGRGPGQQLSPNPFEYPALEGQCSHGLPPRFKIRQCKVGLPSSSMK